MKNRILIILLILFVSAASFAQVDRSKRPMPGPAPVIKIGNYESFELPNGLKVFVVENHKLPRVTFSLVLDTDPVLEGENAGYVSAAGELLRTGTKSRTKDKLDQEIDFLGASLSTSSTSVTASGLTKHKEKILAIMADIIINADFKQEELDKITKQTLSGLAATKDEPNAIARRVQSVLIFGKEHPYGELETEKTVKSVTLDKCKDYYRSFFTPNAAYLAVVGDINKTSAKSLVQKYLGKWEKKEVPKNTYPTPKTPIVNKVSLVDRTNSVQSVISVCYPVELKVGAEDGIKASVVNLILGGSATGRLFMNLRESKAYTYGAYSNLNSDRLIGSFSAFTQVRNSVTDSAVTEIMGEMKRIRNEKVSDEELQKAKNYLSGDFIRDLESPSTIGLFAINTARYNLPKDYYDNYLKNLAAVTAEDVQETARKYIKPNNANILVVGNGDEVAKNLTKFSISGKIDYYDVNGDKYDSSAKKIPAGVTVEQVLNKYVDAIGGRENILKVKDKTMKLTGTVQGMNLTLTISQKEPNKLYQLLDAGVFQQKTIFDGEKGRVSAMGKDTDLSGEQLEELKVESGLYTMLNYTQQGIKTELTGMETVDGKDTYIVTFVLPSGKKTIRYYTVDTGYLVRQVSSVTTPQGTFNQTTGFDDYRDVQGVKYPFKLSQSFGPQVIELTASSIEINTGLSDTLFEIK